MWNIGTHPNLAIFGKIFPLQFTLHDNLLTKCNILKTY